jgi:transcriptional regulator GlxA family with amidase domain
MLGNVAAVVWDSVAPFEMGLLYEGFGIDRRSEGVPPVDFAFCAPSREVRTGGGYGVLVEHDLGRVAEADLVAVAACEDHENIPDPVVEAIGAAFQRGARVLSVCSGAFALGAAGLLDHRECTTHWLHTDELARRFPRARVVPEVLYVDAGPVVTSAGSAAGLDACLHVWRQEYGAAVASAIARRMVVPPQRSGGQAQYIRSAVADCEAETLGPLLTWIVEHLDEPLSVDVLAREAHLSPRTFARRFRAETGTTPHAWITAQRVLLAEELLESTERPVERVAADAGFGNAAALRHHFVRARGVSPQEYRRTFSAVAS